MCLALRIELAWEENSESVLSVGNKTITAGMDYYSHQALGEFIFILRARDEFREETKSAEISVVKIRYTKAFP